MNNWSQWQTDPYLIGAILVAGWAYSLLTGPLRSLLAHNKPYPGKEAAYFALGLATYYLAVGSPLGTLGKGFLLSAQEVQNNVLMYLSPLFIVLGIPSWLVDTPAKKIRYFRPIFKFLVNPVVAGLSFTLVYWVWHIPQFLEAALHSKSVLTLMHLTLFLSSILMWWNIASRSKRFPPLQYGIQILFLFILMVAQTPVSGFLAFAKQTLYPTYEGAIRILPALDPLGDQALGGFISKFTNIVATLAVIGTAFYKWPPPQEDGLQGKT